MQQPAPDQEQDQPNDQLIPDIRERLIKRSSSALFILGLLALPVLLLLNFTLYHKSATARNNVRNSVIAFVTFIAIWIVWLAIFYSSSSQSWTQSLFVGPVVNTS